MLTTKEIIRKKYDRIIQGSRPRVLDLFAGCGGLSLGFHTAGFEIVAAVEIDSKAAKSHAINFFRHNPQLKAMAHEKPRDITQTSPELLTDELWLKNVDSSVDIIVGGPPCQAFARVGRAKLREIAEHPKAFLRDKRADLYLAYLDYVKAFKPLAILVENVPDVLNFGGHNIAEEMCQVLDGMGYNCRYTLLNSAYYGVPQMRERMFLIAYHKEIHREVQFPEPTNWVKLPVGYIGTRGVALKNLDRLNSFYTKPPIANEGLPGAITAREAIDDLPRITLHLEGKLKRGPRFLDKLIKYDSTRDLSDYAMRLRNWPGFENNKGIKDHVIRYLPRDYKFFRMMKPGDQYPEIYKISSRIFQKKIQDYEQKHGKLDENSPEYRKIKKEFLLPYDPSKFPNKWRKMEPDLPARTLMAHLGKDGYSHIHYDDEQARTISIREAARLQSFPDGFVFAGTMNPAFRQIGNSVPPLMAFALAHEMNNCIKGEKIDREVCFKTPDCV